jgi:hypothetical protein
MGQRALANLSWARLHGWMTTDYIRRALRALNLRAQAWRFARMEQPDRFLALSKAVDIDDAAMLAALLSEPARAGWAARQGAWEGPEAMLCELLMSMSDERGRPLLSLCAERGAGECARVLAKWPQWSLSQAHEACSLAASADARLVFDELFAKLWAKELEKRIIDRDPDGFSSLWRSGDAHRMTAFASSTLGRDAGRAWGMSPLAVAAAAGLRVIVDALIPYSDASRSDDRGRTPLHHAANAGRPSAILALAMAGWDPEAHDGDGWSPLVLAFSRLDGAILARDCAGIEPARRTVELLALTISARSERRELSYAVAMVERSRAPVRL